MPETWPGHIPRPVAIIGWDGTRYSAFRLHPGGTVQVRGEDQLFSYADARAYIRTEGLHANDGYGRSFETPANTIYVITNVCFKNTARATTVCIFKHRRGATEVPFHSHYQAIAQNEEVCWGGLVFLDPADYIYCYNIGGQNGDSCTVSYTGYQMTPE